MTKSKKNASYLLRYINIHIVVDQIRTKITYQKKFVVILLEPAKKLLKKRNG